MKKILIAGHRIEMRPNNTKGTNVLIYKHSDNSLVAGTVFDSNMKEGTEEMEMWAIRKISTPTERLQEIPGYIVHRGEIIRKN